MMVKKKSSSGRAHHHQSSSTIVIATAVMNCHHHRHSAAAWAWMIATIRVISWPHQLSSTHISSEAEGKTNTPLCHSMPIGDSNSCYSYSLAAWCISYFFLVNLTRSKNIAISISSFRLGAQAASILQGHDAQLRHWVRSAPGSAHPQIVWTCHDW